MKLLDRLFGRKASELTYDQIASLIDGQAVGSVGGVAVTEKTALQVATVLACVRTIADGCATPALHVYRDTANNRTERAINIPEYRLLARRPNEWQTSFEWRRMMTMHAALCGAGLSIIVRRPNGRIAELIPVKPGSWHIQHLSRYEKRYWVTDEFGLVGIFEPKDVFLLPGLQWDWVYTLDAVSMARNSVGLALATERSAAKMHENGLRPSGVYSVSGTLDDPQYKKLTSWLASMSGPEKAGKPFVLDRDAKWIPQSTTAIDAQAVETRRLQIEEVCRFYGVFPIMVGHSDKTATFASSEAFFAAHVKHTLAPWQCTWTQRIDEMLLDGSGPLSAKFDNRYLLAGSVKDRGEWARSMVEMGIYTRNEVRDEEGLDPLEGLDDPLTPMNMQSGAAPQGNNDAPN